MTSNIINNEKPIVAGVINLLTGEIIETITSPGLKAQLRVKVRDELNKDSEQFFVFDVSMIGPDNLNQVEKHLKADKSFMTPLRLLREEFLLQRSNDDLARLIAHKELLSETLSDCQTLYHHDKLAAKREIITDLLESEIHECDNNIESNQSEIKQIQKKIAIWKQILS
jgi:hypothetical protein